MKPLFRIFGILAILISLLTCGMSIYRSKLDKEKTGNQIVCKAFNATIVSKTADKVSYDVFRFDKMFDGTGYMTAVISKDKENALLPKNYYVNKDCLKF